MSHDPAENVRITMGISKRGERTKQVLSHHSSIQIATAIGDSNNVYRYIYIYKYRQRIF